MNEELETQIAMQTEAGRESMAVWWGVLDDLTGAQRLERAFELTDTARQVMRDGIRHQNQDACEEEIQSIYVQRLLNFHGITLAEIRDRQARGI